jgi:hypothetical protein
LKREICMRTITAFYFSLFLIVGISWGQQNRLPSDEAKGYAKLCVERAAAVLTDPPVRMDVDPDKPCAERGEGGGAMIVPDKNLTEKALAGVGKDVLPVGQLWLRKWTLVVNGKPVGNDKLRIINVTVDDKERPMPLLLLGVRKGEKALELVIFASGSEPLQIMPLKKLDQVQDLPVQLEWSRGDKDSDNLTLNILGKHEGVLKIARAGK